MQVNMELLSKHFWFIRFKDYVMIEFYAQTYTLRSFFYFRNMFGRFIFRLVQFMLKITGLIFNPLNNWVFSKIYDGDGKTVPKVENDILLQSAAQLANKIRSKEVHRH